MTIRVGVIGLGIGERHVQEYLRLPGVAVSAIADTRPDRLAEKAARYGVCPYEDGVAMMDGEKLDAVSVCTPPVSHRRFVEAAAARGLHVLCEKPMAPTVVDCDAMMAACQKAGVVLLLGFKKRSSPPFSFLKEQEEEWGEPRVAHVRYQLGPVPKDWFWNDADGGGPFIENTAHAFDMMRFLIGEVERVYAEGDNFFSPGRDMASEMVCTLRFRNGSIASLAAGTAGIWAYDESERWVLSYDRLNVELSGPFDVPRKMRVIKREGGPVEEHWWQEASGWGEQMQHFIDCIEGKAQPRASGEEGKRALQIGLAVKQSIREQKPVELG